MAWNFTARSYWTSLSLLLGLGLLLTSLRNHAQALPASEGIIADSTELRVLRQFYQATGGPQWKTQNNWLQGTTLAEAATWYGVYTGGGDVTGLSLSYNNLQGTLPVSLGQLRQLSY